MTKPNSYPAAQEAGAAGTIIGIERLLKVSSERPTVNLNGFVDEAVFAGKRGPTCQIETWEFMLWFYGERVIRIIGTPA